MVGDWWFTPGNLSTGNENQPLAENSHVVVCWAHVLEPRSMITDFLIRLQFPTFVGINGFFNYFMVVMHLDASVEATTFNT